MALVFTGLTTKGSFNLVYTLPPPATPPVSGYLWAWGNNDTGQVGLNNQTNYSSPKQIGSLTTWTKVSASLGNHTLAVKTDGTLWAWGNNGYGRLGFGNTSNCSSPIQVGALTDWATVSAGGGFGLSSAIKTDGTLWTWGYGGDGALGQGNTTARSSPTQVGALTNWLSVSASSYGCMAIKTDGTLWAWGNNGYGRLGLGDTTNRSSPTQVGALTNWSKIAARAYNGAAIKTDGTLWTWGYNAAGQIGDGTTTSKSSPVQVGSLTNWSVVHLTQSSAVFAVKTDGTLWAWGSGTLNTLGLGNTTNYSSPKQVGGSTNWSSVSGGLYNGSAIKTDGTIWSWGYNALGELGLGDTVTRSTPVQIGALTTWKIINSARHTMAISS